MNTQNAITDVKFNKPKEINLDVLSIACGLPFAGGNKISLSRVLFIERDLFYLSTSSTRTFHIIFRDRENFFSDIVRLMLIFAFESNF